MLLLPIGTWGITVMLEVGATDDTGTFSEKPKGLSFS